MTQLAFATNFANPAFMASMAPGDALGRMIVAANRFMDVTPYYKPAQVASVKEDLFDASHEVPGMVDVYRSSIGILATAEFLKKAQTYQAMFQKQARPLFDEHIGRLAREVAEGRAGIPFFRPKSRHLISPGFRAAELRRLMDYGLVNPAPVQSLAHELSSRLFANMERLYEKKRRGIDPVALNTLFLMSMISAALSVHTALEIPPEDQTIVTALTLPILSLCLLLPGMISSFRTSRSEWTDLERRALNISSIRDYKTILVRRIGELKKLCREYDRAFERVDWRERTASVPPPASRGASGGGA